MFVTFRYFFENRICFSVYKGNNHRLMTNSELLEELMHELWKLGLIDEVREIVSPLIRPNMSTGEIYDIYERAFLKIKSEKRDVF